MIMFTSYGTDTITPTMKKILKKEAFPKNRFNNIVDYVEKKAINMPIDKDEDFKEVKKYLAQDLENIVRVKDNTYLVWDKNISWTSRFSIKEIDIDRPWTYTSYDGAEGFKYLDENKLIDKDLNYYDCE